jgi:hypothetical protein
MIDDARNHEREVYHINLDRRNMEKTGYITGMLYASIIK